MSSYSIVVRLGFSLNMLERIGNKCMRVEEHAGHLRKVKANRVS